MSDEMEWRLAMESRMSAVETTVEDMEHTLNGNGRAGFVEQVNAYIYEQRGAWKALIRVGGILAFIITGLLAWLTYRDSRRSELQRPQTSIVQPKQDAGNPPL